MKPAVLHVATLALAAALAATGMPAQAGGVGTWLKAPDLLEEHVGHTATRLADGRVLVAGGANLGGGVTAKCELFDPKTNRWIRAASMHMARSGHSATLLSNGDVLVAGGRQSLNGFPVAALTSAEIYDPRSNRWALAASMRVPRVMHSAVHLRDNRVLVVGGIRPLLAAAVQPSGTEKAEIYNPARDAWSLVGAGLSSLDDQAVTLMPDGRVLVTGGATEAGFATADAELFDPRTDQWRAATWPLADARFGHTATLLPDGRVLLVGGYTTQRRSGAGIVYPSALTTTSEVFDLRGNIGVRMGYSTIPRFDHTATLLRSGLVLVVGSAYDSDADSQLFDPRNTEMWISTDMPMDRYLHTATLLADGRVLIAGGYGIGSLKTAWIFVPAGVATSSSRGAGVTEPLAIGLVLFMLFAISVVVTVRRSHRRPKGPIADGDTRWVDP